MQTDLVMVSMPHRKKGRNRSNSVFYWREVDIHSPCLFFNPEDKDYLEIMTLTWAILFDCCRNMFCAERAPIARQRGSPVLAEGRPVRNRPSAGDCQSGVDSNRPSVLSARRPRP